MDLIYPKISIITPNYNGATYLEDTINSILDQQYPNLEYIIIDGGSTDDSVDIIKKYEDRVDYWISEQDDGMYYALNKGFAKSTGDIMGWLNSDDMLHPKSLFSLAEIFNKSEVEWVQGVHSWTDKIGRTFQVEKVRLRSKYRYLMKDYHHGVSPFIQQESTYWKRSLWNRAGSYISTDYQIAGDFELWMRFFSNGQLFLTNSLIGGFRYTGEGQFSVDNYKKYLGEADQVIDNYKHTQEEQDDLEFLTTKSWIDNVPYFRRARYRKRHSILKNIKEINWHSEIGEFVII